MQRKKILDSVRASSAPVIKLDAKIAEELPSTVVLSALPPVLKSEMQDMNDLKFVRLENKT